MSDDVSADIPDVKKDNSKNEMPMAIKIGVPLFILVVILAVFFGYKFYKESKDAPVFSDEELSVIKTTDNPNIVDSPENKLLKEVINDKTIIELGESLSGLSKEVEGVNLFINQTKEQQVDLGIGVDFNKESIAAILIKVDSLQQKVINLSSLLEIVTNKVSSYHRKSKKKITKRSNRPPFILLSIDQWGSMNSAVIELSGKSSLANLGDIKAGWRIANINLPNCIDVIRLSDSMKATICRTGER